MTTSTPIIGADRNDLSQSMTVSPFQPASAHELETTREPAHFAHGMSLWKPSQQ